MYQSTAVYRYLIFLQKYLLADLLLFHELSVVAEQMEKSIGESSKNGLLARFLKLFSSFSSTSMTAITTSKYPYSFEFMFSSSVVARSTIPHTTILFSTIDILGYLNRNKPDFRNTTENFNTFFSHPTTRIDPIELEILTKVFRHGMAHNYFPKLNMEISYHSSNPSGQIFFKNAIGDLVLNVNSLESILTKRLESIINSSELYSNMDKQFTTMVDQYESESRLAIDKLKARL